MDNLPTPIETLLACAVNDNIEFLEQWSLQYPQLEIPAKESFVNGMYTREIMVPADSIITGRVWQHAYVDVMISGDITVASPDGLKRITGYNHLRGVKGRKRAGYAHADTHWLTVHRTDLEDPGKMVDQLTFFSMGEYAHWRDRVDFLTVLNKLGVSQEQAWAQSCNESDRVNLNMEHLEVRESPIAGVGLYTNTSIKADEVICPARVADLRTEAGRYTNHSAVPNCVMRWEGADMVLVAIQDIRADDELTVDYRHPELLTVNVEEA